MASGTLTAAGNIKLQEKIALIAKKLTLTGTQDVFGQGTVALEISTNTINWAAPNNSDGIQMVGYESFNIGCSTTVTPRVVQGVELQTLGGDTLLTQNFASSSTYTFADDAQNGRFTVSELEVNFS